MTTFDRLVPHSDVFSLRPVGWGRYVDVAFLAVWVLGWFVFEVAGLALLAAVLSALVAGVFGFTPAFGTRLVPDGAATLMLLFVLVWLTLWTAGGVGALRRLLRSAAGEDRISVSPTGLEIEWRAGPFRRQRTIPHGALHRVRLKPKDDTLVVDTAAGAVDVTSFGTRDDRAALLAWLQRRLVLPMESEARRREAEAMPRGWEVDIHGSEARLTRVTRRVRAIQSAVLWTLAGLILTSVIAAQFRDQRNGADLAAGVLGLLLALLATWTTWGRTEWLVGRRRLARRRSFATWDHEQPFEHGVLELLHHVDSDGDHRYTLRVRSETATRTIATALYDPGELVSLGEWLSARTGFPFERPPTLAS